MFHLNKIQRLIVSIFIPIISMAVLGVSKYAPDTILVTILVAFLSELYLWRTIQPQRRRTLPSLPSKKQVSLTLGHLFASVIISIALSSNHEFKKYFGADDEGATAILLFFLYWGIIVVIPWGFRRVRTELKMNTLQKPKVKESSSVIPQESRQSAEARPNVLSLTDKPKYERFGDDLTRIKNVKVTTKKGSKSSSNKMGLKSLIIVCVSSVLAILLVYYTTTDKPIGTYEIIGDNSSLMEKPLSRKVILRKTIPRREVITREVVSRSRNNPRRRDAEQILYVGGVRESNTTSNPLFPKNRAYISEKDLEFLDWLFSLDTGDNK